MPQGSTLCLEATRATLLRPIYPRYTNRYGTLHGGRLAWWILESGSMAAMKASRGYVVLGAIDYLFILSPGRLGENLNVYSWVIGSTRHTLDVLTYATAEPVGGGEERPVSLSIQTYVAVDENVRPREHGVEVRPCSLEAEALTEIHRAWLEERRALVEERHKIASDTSRLTVPYHIESYQIVGPDSTFSLHNVLDASKLFYTIDQIAAIAAIKAARAPVVTASFDAAVFASPARVGNILRLEAGVTGVGRTSIEVLVKVVADDPVAERSATVAKLYTVLVSVGPDGRPSPPPVKPVVPEELQKGFMERKRVREEKRRKVREIIEALKSMLYLV
ncbi:acyl-CoA thioesterase [Hyperthermus butylicus]|nr:hotdog domain-containing protein [Hyperthermus butylicus]